MSAFRATLLCCAVAAATATACGGTPVTRPRASGLTREVPAIVGRACRQAAAQVAIPVACPRLVPRTRYVHYAGLWGAIVFSPRTWLVTFNNGDNGAGYVHWIVGDGGRDDVRYYVLGDEQNVVKGLPKLWATKSVGGRTLIEYRFPDYPAGGPNGGHAAAFVPCGTRYVFASLHSYERMRLAQRMALDLAGSAGCPPEPRAEPDRSRTMPAPPAVTGACDRIGRAPTRRRGRWRPVCPPLVPWSHDTEVDYAGGVLSTRGFRRGYLIDGESNSPSGHWTFASGDPSAVHADLSSRDVRGGPLLEVTRRKAAIHGQGVSIYRVDFGSMSQLSGHLAIEWTWHGQAYQVSVHRRAGDRPALVQATQMAAAVIGYLRHARLPFGHHRERPR